MIGSLLIAAGFGYVVFAYATKKERGRMRKLGQSIGLIMIVSSLALSALKLYKMCSVYCGTGGKGGYHCPFTPKGFPPGDRSALPAK